MNIFKKLFPFLFNMKSKHLEKELPQVEETFEEWFSKQNIRNFTAKEFRNYFNIHRRGVRNSEPPRELWPNILPALRVVDKLRDYLGTACTITSSYRSPAYNGAISGAASKSLHMQFRALDIQFKNVSPAKVFQVLHSWRRDGSIKGGLGKYKTFTHIDDRETNPTWGN